MPHFLLLSQGFFFFEKEMSRKSGNKDWQVPLLSTHLFPEFCMSLCWTLTSLDAWFLGSSPSWCRRWPSQVKKRNLQSLWDMLPLARIWETCSPRELPRRMGKGTYANKKQIEHKHYANTHVVLLIAQSVGGGARKPLAEVTGSTVNRVILHSFQTPTSQVPSWLQLQLLFLQWVCGTGVRQLPLSNVLAPLCKHGQRSRGKSLSPRPYEPALRERKHSFSMLCEQGPFEVREGRQKKPSYLQWARARQWEMVLFLKTTWYTGNPRARGTLLM